MTSRVHSSWQQVRRLLVVRLDSLGDVLMTTPAIAALKESLPGVRITLLTSPAGAGLVPYLSDVDETLVYQAPWMKAPADQVSAGEQAAFIERLRSEQFDAAVIFTVYSQSPLPAALTLFMADIPLRMAYCRENPYHLLTDWVREPEPEQFVRHEVQRHLDLAAAAGCETTDPRLRFTLQPEDDMRTVRKLIEVGVDVRQPFIAIHPGSSAPSRRYPPERFAEVAQQLIQSGFQVVLSGTRQESDLIELVRRAGAPEAISLAGLLSLGELAVVLKLAEVLISNNSGPVHLAAALGRPVVDLYALTNPQHTPWHTPSIVLAKDVPCRFCYKSICPMEHHACLRAIDPQWVVDAALWLIENRPPEEFCKRFPEGVLFTGFPAADWIARPAA